ncbi:MAG: hypothetical protein LH616_19590 [Ilumatobacteraceae bacterium]|nr:hypothetical protein [Ilumatobacteraceae bacterium]
MPNIGRLLRRTIRPLWIAGLGAAAWSNRAKVQEALGHKPAAVPGDGESVTLRTTVATWTKPLRGRHRSTTVHAPSSSLPADMTAAFTEPTVIVPAKLTNSSSVSEEV